MAIWAAVALLICFISARQKVAFIWLLLFFQSRGAPPFQCVLVFAGFSFSHPTSLHLPHLTACRQTPHFFHLSFSYECCHFNFFFFSFWQGLVLKSSGTFCSAVVPISQSTKSPSPSPGEWSRCSLQNPFAARLRNPQNSLSPPLSLISPIRIQIWPLALFTPSLPVLASITVWPPQVNAMDFLWPGVSFYSPVITLLATMIILDFSTHGRSTGKKWQF